METIILANEEVTKLLSHETVINMVDTFFREWNNADCLAICKKAAELGIPVLVSLSMVDPRQKHWMDTEETISFKQICELAEKVENLKIICSGLFIYNTNDYDELAPKPYRERIYFDTSRCLKSAWYQNLAYGVKKLGAQPFRYGVMRRYGGAARRFWSLNVRTYPRRKRKLLPLRLLNSFS